MASANAGHSFVAVQTVLSNVKMKALILVFLLVLIPGLLNAQQKYKYPRSPAVVETVRDSKGKSHTRRRVTAVPERHTVTRWHYHKGYRRVSQRPAER